MAFFCYALCSAVSQHVILSAFGPRLKQLRLVAPETKQPKAVEYVARCMAVFLGRLPLIMLDMEQATRDEDVLGELGGYMCFFRMYLTLTPLSGLAGYVQ